MEYIPKGDLHKMIDRFKTVPPRYGLGKELSLLYLAQLINAIEVLQKEAVVHRDLKPLNVMIDKHFNLKLIDFGEAKSIDDSEARRERSDTFVGTYNYMSPEVFQHSQQTTAVDIWALGLIYFKMRIGKPAFPGLNEKDIEAKVIERGIKWPSEYKGKDHADFDEDEKDLVD